MYLSTSLILVLLSFATFFTHTTFAVPILPRIWSHQQQVSLFAQNYRPVIKHKYPSESGQIYHKDGDDDKEHHCRNVPGDDYDDLKDMNTCEGSNTNPCYMAALIADMSNIATSASPLTFEASLDSDNYYQLMRSINGKQDIFLMQISFTDNHCSKTTQSWYQRWTSLWSKNRSVDDGFSKINRDGSHSILGQLMSMLPIDNGNDNDNNKNILFTLIPFPQLTHYSPYHLQHNDYHQIEQRSIENDTVMEVITNDVVF